MTIDEEVVAPKKRTVSPEWLWRKVCKLTSMRTELTVLEFSYEKFREAAACSVGELHEDVLKSLDDLYKTIKSEAELKFKSFSNEVRSNILD